MPTRIRLVRQGKRNSPFYRLVVADRQKPLGGRFIEVLGSYNPSAKEQSFVADRERVNFWISQGALPTETVAMLLKKTAHA